MSLITHYRGNLSVFKPLLTLHNNLRSQSRPLASKMLNSQKEFFNYLPKSRNADSFFSNLVTQTEIDTEIMNTPLNKAHRLYSFPTRVLR